MKVRSQDDGLLAPPSVLHVMWSLGIGGAERALYQLVVAQRAAGAHVGVLAARDAGFYGERLYERGIEVHALGQRHCIDLSAARRARSVFGRWPIVHFHVAEPLLMLAAATSGARTYYTHRAGAFRYPMRRRARYQAAGAVMRRRFSAIVGNTEHAAGVASALFRVPRDRVGVVYNGIDWELLRPERNCQSVRAELGLTADDIVVGTSGNLRGCKRVDILIKALAQVSDRILCVIVGDGPERGALEELVRENGVAARVRFVGRTANVADYLQVMQVFALPSGPEESFGNSAVEAMGFGLPTIVLRDGGGLIEHVLHEQTGVIADGANGLARWIDRLGADAQLRNALGANARASVFARYSTDQMVQGYARVYGTNTFERQRPLRRGG